MKTFASFVIMFLLSVFWVATGGAGNNPIGVSLGSETGSATVSQRCPTFSWSAVEQASSYRIAVIQPPDATARAYWDMAGMDGKTADILKSHYGKDYGSEGVNTFYGIGAGASITTGVSDTFIGVNAGQYNTAGGWNTFLGDSAGASNTTGDNNTFLGNLAGASNTTGYDNTFIGTTAGVNNTTGTSNIFLGESAGNRNTTGSSNTILGAFAGFYNTTGYDNTFIGLNAGVSNTTGYSNTFIGLNAGNKNTTGNGNTFIGNEAGLFEVSSNKLYIDNSDTSDPLIYGEFDNNIVNINGKLGIGTKTPGYPMEILRTGSNASIVLNRTDGAKNYVNATASFGNFGTVNNYPLRLVVNSLGKMTLNTDNSLSMASGATCTAGGVWTNASSIALKENVTSLNSDEAATTLQALNPVKYNYKAEKDENHVGFIAEEVPELVAMKDRKSLSPMDIVAVLTKVTQDQQKIVENLTLKMQDQQQLNQQQQQFAQDQQKQFQNQQMLTQKQLKEQQQINEKMKMEIAELKKTRSE
jgi:hypothetical protein